MRAAIILILLFPALQARSQSAPFLLNGKWGIRDSIKIIVPAKYDTVFGFDPLGKVCMGCFLVKKNTSNKYVRVTSVKYACNYLDAKNERLVIKDGLGDTSSVFSLGKQSVAQYSTGSNVMAVSVKGVKNLVTKNFKQLTFRGYHNISATTDKNFYLCEYQNESETVLQGLVDKDEEEVIPYRYTSIKFNNHDSLIICCSAGLINATDDVYDFQGHRLLSSTKHIEQANKHYILQKVFEPSKQFFLLNRLTGTDKALDADEVGFSDSDEVVVRKKDIWYTYDAETGVKKQIKQP